MRPVTSFFSFGFGLLVSQLLLADKTAVAEVVEDFSGEEEVLEEEEEEVLEELDEAFVGFSAPPCCKLGEVPYIFGECNMEEALLLGDPIPESTECGLLFPFPEALLPPDVRCPWPVLLFVLPFPGFPFVSSGL